MQRSSASGSAWSRYFATRPAYEQKLAIAGIVLGVVAVVVLVALGATGYLTPGGRGSGGGGTGTATPTATLTSTCPNQPATPLDSARWSAHLDVDYERAICEADPAAAATALRDETFRFFQLENCTYTSGRSAYALGAAEADTLVTVDPALGALRLRMGGLGSDADCAANHCGSVTGSGAPCRATIKLTAKDNHLYGAGTLWVMNGRIPYVCGTWPAFWTTGNDWPNQGEADLLETANRLTDSTGAWHTKDGCFLDPRRLTNGSEVALGRISCYDPSINNLGCEVRNAAVAPRDATWALFWNPTGFTGQGSLEYYYWPEGTGYAELHAPTGPFGTAPDPGQWDARVWAYLSLGPADLPDWQGCPPGFWGPQRLVINTELGGGYVDDKWGPSGCTGTVEDAVSNMDPNDPNTEWRIRHIRVCTRV